VPTKSSTHPRRTVVRVIVLLLALLAVMSLRQPDKLYTPQFWAEDGPVFYLEAEYHETASLVRPYNGYWHVYPRLVALVGTRLPVKRLPALYAWAAIVATVGALLAVLSARLSERASIRAAMVAAVLLAPFTGELWLTLTNAQWFGALLLVALLASPPPATAVGAVAWSLGGIVMGLSGPFAMLLWPCAALRAWWHRDRWSGWVLALFSIVAAATMLALAAHPRGGGIATLPQRLVPLLHVALSHKRALIAGCAGSLLFPVGLVHGVRHRQWALTACSVAGLLVMASTVATIPIEHLTTRYVFIPWAVGSWTALMLAERGYRLAWVAVVGALVISLAGLRLPPLQPYPWARDAACLEREAVCDVTVNPSWRVGLPGRGTKK
jgi:hypothetical protein